MIIGNIGAGKSTLAKKLHEATSIPLTHLDTLFFRPNCEFTPKEEWTEIVSNLIQKEEWIIDGNYPNTLLIRAARADTVILLDPSRMICYRNLINRTIKKYFSREIRSDTSIYKCDKFSFNTIKRIWIFKSKTVKYYSEILNMPNKKIYHFKLPQETIFFIENLNK